MSGRRSLLRQVRCSQVACSRGEKAEEQPQRAAAGRAATRASPSVMARTGRSAFGGTPFNHIAVRFTSEVGVPDPTVNEPNTQLNVRRSELTFPHLKPAA